MEPETPNIEEENEICKIRGLDLILMSINCEKYKSKFTSYGINEYTMLHLTAEDLRSLDVDNEDIPKILTAVNVLNKTLNLSEIRLSNDDILKLQSNICGHLGSIVLILNHICCYLTDSKNNFNDVLIDDCLSAVDAAMMVKPYLRAEEKNIEKSLKRVYKMKQRRTLLFASTTVVCTVFIFGFAYQRLSSQFSPISSCSNLLSCMKIWPV